MMMLDCSNNMMVTIYLIKKGYFIYCNDNFKKIVGGNQIKLLKDGWDYWFSLIDSKESLQVKNRIFAFFSAPYVQGSFVFKYHITNVYGEKISVCDCAGRRAGPRNLRCWCPLPGQTAVPLSECLTRG